MSKIQEAINLSKRKTELLIEFKSSKEEENSKIIVDNIIIDNRRLFIAIERSTEKQIHDGSAEDVMGFLAKRGYTEIFWRPLKKK